MMFARLSSSPPPITFYNDFFNLIGIKIQAKIHDYILSAPQTKGGDPVKRGEPPLPRPTKGGRSPLLKGRGGGWEPTLNSSIFTKGELFQTAPSLMTFYLIGFLPKYPCNRAGVK